MKRLAIMDYGIGGLDLFLKIKHNFPEIGITYFSDSGETPYGKLPKTALKQRMTRVLQFLKTLNCHTVIVACHSASTVAENIEGLATESMIPHTQISVGNGNGGSLGIIAGGRTVRSGLYRDYFTRKGHTVVQRVGQQLSILIESGCTDEDIYHKTLVHILNPIKHVDRLLLACTHYPVLTPLITKLMKPDCEVIDPMHSAFERLTEKIQSHSNGNDYFLTSGNAKLMRDSAFRIHGLHINKINEWETNLTKKR